MTDHDMGWPNQGRDSEECLEATRSILASRGFWIGLPISLALWTVIAMVIAAVFS